MKKLCHPHFCPNGPLKKWRTAAGVYAALSMCFALTLAGCIRGDDSTNDWPEYLGSADRNHYSQLTEINLDNVINLEKAWEYHTGDSGQIQCNPIIIKGRLYAMTATTEPFCLDAATGKELWRVKDTTGTTWYSTSRGVAYWADGSDERILYTKESYLYAIDARSGLPVLQFGDSGKVSLKSGLGETSKDKFVISNTPGTIFEDLIIMPLRLSEGADAAPGYIQAFDVRSGRVRWVFRTIPKPGDEGYDTWPPEAYQNPRVGAANNWAGMAIDRQREIVYIPTGSAAFDFFGGERKGANLFANTLLALDANTGKKIWHYQLVHHDILDRDPPAPPNLLTVTHQGKKIDAVAQVTKQGFVFLFDRVTGAPLFPIEEVPAPVSDIPGEESWPTQPRPTKPLPFARQTLTEADINPHAPNREALLSLFRSSRFEGPFTPLSAQGTIIFPGLDGGAEWGGAAADPEGVLYVNSNEMAWWISLGPENKTQSESHIPSGESLYVSKCSACHGRDRNGNASSGFPSLVNLEKRLDRESAQQIVVGGKGMMPAFTGIKAEEMKLLLDFLYSEKKDNLSEATTASKPKEPGLENDSSAWKISGYTKFLDSSGYPAISPPWGTLHAIDMNTGEYRWSKVYGETPALKDTMQQTGSESYGGPVVTRSGLLFIAGTKDAKFRAYDKSTGDLVWETRLPAAAFATPSTYAVNGKQYIVVACGGTKLGAPKGDSYVAFSLK